MGAATLEGTMTEDRWSSMGVRAFACAYNATNYNDTVVYLPCPQALLDSAKGCNIRFRSLHVAHSASANVTIDPYIYMDVNIGAYLSRYTTPAGFCANAWNIDTPRTYLSLTGALVTLTMAGYLATDDMLITLIGELHATPAEPQSVPVSLEGYKWPLTRR